MTYYTFSPGVMEKMKKESAKALKEMYEISQELGLYNQENPGL